MSETVTITVERLKELEKYEAKIKAKNAKDTIRLAEYHKTHPEKTLARVNRHIEKDRDAYNAKRRERRRLAKEAAAVAAKPPVAD
jgi:hypothetical protein